MLQPTHNVIVKFEDKIVEILEITTSHDLDWVIKIAKNHVALCLDGKSVDSKKYENLVNSEIFAELEPDEFQYTICSDVQLKLL